MRDLPIKQKLTKIRILFRHMLVIKPPRTLTIFIRGHTEETGVFRYIAITHTASPVLVPPMSDTTTQPHPSHPRIAVLDSGQPAKRARYGKSSGLDKLPGELVGLVTSFFTPEDAARTRSCNKAMRGRDDLRHYLDDALVKRMQPSGYKSNDQYLVGSREPTQVRGYRII